MFYQSAVIMKNVITLIYSTSSGYVLDDLSSKFTFRTLFLRDSGEAMGVESLKTKIFAVRSSKIGEHFSSLKISNKLNSYNKTVRSYKLLTLLLI